MEISFCFAPGKGCVLGRRANKFSTKGTRIDATVLSRCPGRGEVAAVNGDDVNSILDCTVDVVVLGRSHIAPHRTLLY